MSSFSAYYTTINGVADELLSMKCSSQEGIWPRYIDDLIIFNSKVDFTPNLKYYPLYLNLIKTNCNLESANFLDLQLKVENNMLKITSRRKQRSAFDQVSEFDRGRIVAYRDCGLSFREIGSRVGRNQTTVMRICDRWMQEGTTDRRGRSHPPHCNTSREDRQIVHMAVKNRSVTSRTVKQHIESVTHHSESAHTIRCRLQQSGLSASRRLLGLPLTQNHRRLRRQWCDERRMWVAEWNEVVFTDESHICLQHQDGRIRVWKHRGEKMLNIYIMHSHTGPAPGIMVWSGIRYHFLTPLVRIAGTLNSQCFISEVRPAIRLLVATSNTYCCETFQ
ncbi:transposable element Tcb1 transposase [Trichonephila clavipes]|nr:transposable element Tcb1 transposase [Trichonephila clavipes]